MAEDASEPCSVCDGRGNYATEDERGGSDYRTECDACNGTGRTPPKPDSPAPSP